MPTKKTVVFNTHRTANRFLLSKRERLQKSVERKHVGQPPSAKPNKMYSMHIPAMATHANRSRDVDVIFLLHFAGIHRHKTHTRLEC